MYLDSAALDSHEGVNIHMSAGTCTCAGTYLPTQVSMSPGLFIICDDLLLLNDMRSYVCVGFSR